MSSKNLVTVVIPVFNRTIFLPQSIESVLHQTYKYWELLIVDDGSTEDVEQVARHFNDPRIILIRQDNLGNAAARNTGIERANGKYSICLDSDDFWHPDLLQKSVDIFEQGSEIDVVYSQYKMVDASGSDLPKPPSPRPLSGNLLMPMLMGHPIVPSSALVRSSNFIRWGKYLPGMDDMEMWLRWSAHGCRFFCLEETLLYYRLHDQNLNLDWKTRRQIHFKMLDAFYESGNVPAEAKDARNRVYANQHRYFSVRAWQANEITEAIDEAMKAVSLNTDLLRDVGFYTEIACVHQGRIYAGSTFNLDLSSAERSLTTLLNGLFRSEPNPLTQGLREREAKGWAYYSLGKLAYSSSSKMNVARRYLLKSIVFWPIIIIISPWIVWFTRSIIGYLRLQRVKAIALRIMPVFAQHDSS